MDTALAQLHDRLCALEQENALLRSRLQSCERSHAVLQAEVGEYRRREQEGQESATQEPIAELATLNISTLEHHLLEATAQVANALLTIAPFGDAVNTALQILGESLETDRVAVIENVDVPSAQLPYWRILYEWDAPHVSSQLLHPDAAQGRYQDLEEWCKRFSQGQGISALLKEVPELLRIELAKVGVQATHVVPISVEGQWWGVIGFDDCCEAKRRSAAELSVLKIAADCIGSAIQRERTQQALLRAEQNRAAELAKANEALRNAIAGLARLDNLDQFLAEMLKVSLEVTGAHTGAVDLIVGEFVRHAALFDKAGWVSPDTQAERGTLFSPFSAELRLMAQRTLESEDAWVCFPNDLLHPPSFQAFHHEQGNRSICLVPMRTSNRLLGWLGLGFAQEDPPLGRSSALLRVLAEQMTMAVEMLRLAEEAKQAAIAREQEKAAQERAAELAKANEVLGRSLNRLANERNLDSFLEHILQEALQMLDGAIAQFFIYDPEADTLMPSIAVDLHGEVLPAPGLMNNLPISESFPGTITKAWERMLNQRSPIYFEIIRDADDYWPGTLDWHRSMGHCGAICTALMMGDQPLGMLGLSLRGRSGFTASEFEFFHALAQQATLAIQLTRLAEEAKQAAIAREQEKAAQERAAELAKANEALRRGVERLAEVGNIDALLDSFLLEAMTVTGASAGAVFDRVAGTEFQMRSLAQDGRLINPADTEAFGDILRAVSARDPVGVFRQIIEAQVYCHTVDDYYASWFPEAAAFHQQQGNQVTWNFSFRVGGAVVGFLGLAFREHWLPNQVVSETVQALGHQVSLALETLRLAEEVKQAAIAREQEKAAQERAAELAKANDALRRSVGHLTTTDNLYCFLVAALQEAVQASGAETGAIFVYDAPSHSLQVNVLVLKGEVVNIASDPRAELWRNPVPADSSPAWEMIEQRQIVWLSLSQPSPEAWQFAVAWHQQLGHKTIPMIPLAIGDRVLGFLGLAFTTEQPPDEFRFEQCRTFAHHAALALQMADLMQQAKQAAIFEERNRMASEIHDTLAQAFTGISLQLEVAKSLVEEDPQAVQQILNHISQLAEAGLTEARRSVWALYPPATEFADLAQLLYDSVEQMTRNTSTSIEVNLQGSPCSLPPFIGMNLLRIGQEALTNALKHAQAQRITIELVYEVDRILLTIRDNGRGFTPPDTIDNLNGGFGLVGMYERCDRIGAQLSLTSQPGQGTQILVEAPLS